MSRKSIEELNLMDRFLFAEAAENKEFLRSESRHLQTIAGIVEGIRHDEKVGIRYMQAWEELIEERMEGREEGLAEGRAEGLAEGRAEGEANGLLKGKVEIIKNMLAAGLDAARIAEFTGMSEEYVNELAQRLLQ